ncbi:MAG: hypothetical protein ACLP4V_24710 [Methylocella sp.]
MTNAKKKRKQIKEAVKIVTALVAGLAGFASVPMIVNIMPTHAVWNITSIKSGDGSINITGGSDGNKGGDVNITGGIGGVTIKAGDAK